MGHQLGRDHDSTPQIGVDATLLVKRSLSRLYDCLLLFSTQIDAEAVCLSTQQQDLIVMLPTPSKQWPDIWDDTRRQRHWDSTSIWTNSEKHSNFVAKPIPTPQPPYEVMSTFPSASSARTSSSGFEFAFHKEKVGNYSRRASVDCTHEHWRG